MRENKNGFSLVELIATIVIIGVLSTSVVMSVNYIMKKADKKYYDSQKESMILAAKSYTNANRNVLPKRTGDTVEIYLATLQKKKFIGDIFDRGKNKCDSEKSYVQVFKYDQNHYNYQSNLKCKKYCDKSKKINFDFLWSGVEKYNNFDDAKCKVKIRSDENIFNYSYIVKVNDEAIDSKVVRLDSKKKELYFQLGDFLPGEVSIEVAATDCFGNSYSDDTSNTLSEKIVKDKIDVSMVWSGVEKRNSNDKARCNVVITADDNISSYSYEVRGDNNVLIDSKTVKLEENNLTKKVEFQLKNFPPGKINVIVKAQARFGKKIAKNTTRTLLYISNKEEFEASRLKSKITLKLNKGKSNQKLEDEYYEGTKIILEEPKRLGYTFIGWEITSGDAKISRNILTTGTCDTTVEARWRLLRPVDSYYCKNRSVGSEPYYYYYTGNCIVSPEEDDNWEMKFLTSGTLKINAPITPKIDLFLVGGGSRGNTGRYECHTYHSWNSKSCTKGVFYDGSSGTPGGYRTVRGIDLSNQVMGYKIVVGDAAQTSTAFGYFAEGAVGKREITKFEEPKREVFCKRGTPQRANTGNSGYGEGEDYDEAEGSSGVVIIRNAR